MLRKTVIAVITAAIVVCAGCESHTQSKNAAKERWNKNSAQIKLNLAEQQYNEADYENAEKTLQQCLAADPDNAQAHLLHGKLLLTTDRADEAIQELSIVVQHQEDLHEGWYLLGAAAEQKGQYNKAYEHYQKALTLDSTNVDYILAVVDAQAERGNFSQAVNLLNEKMAALPSDVSLKTTAAELMWRTGKNESAIELYRQAMLMTSDDKKIAESLGYCYIFSDKWDKAAEIFNELNSRCTNDSEAKLYLQLSAMCNMNSGQYDRAISCYDKLSVFERNNAQIWVKIGQAALGTGAAGRAFICGKKALTLQPGLPDAIALIGCAQYAAGDYSTAAQSFEKITADKKNAGFAYLMKARCYEKLGQTKKAKDTYKKALEMNPQSELGNLLVKSIDGK